MYIKRLLLICCCLAVFLSGCGGPRVDLVETGKVSLETEAGQRVRILDAYVYQTDKEVVVTAAIRRVRMNSIPLKIHITTAIATPDGATSFETTEDVFVPRWRPGKSPSIMFYRNRIPDIPVEGSIVSVTCR